VRGVLTQFADRLTIDNVTVTSALNNFFLFDANDSLLMNSTAPYATVDGATALAMIGGRRNVIVNNTFGGTIPTGGQYSFNAGGVVFYNSQDNRYENNVLQNFRDDGLDFHAKDLTADNMPAPQNLQKSSGNYAGKNTIISDARSKGRVAGAAIWANCASDRTWLFGNDTRGVPECGICVYTSTSNMILANTLHDNGLGFLLSGGDETLPFCAPPAFQERPTSTFIKSNNASWNISEQMYVRSATNTEVASNFMSPRNGFQGVLRPEACETIYCQSALTVDTQGTTPATSGLRVVANTNHENIRGFYSDDGKTTGVEYAYNRMIQQNLGLSHSRYIFPAGTAIWDAGPAAGGNFWTLFTGANGNPGNATYGTASVSDASKGVFQDFSNNTGRIVDRYAYKSEDMGRGSAVAVFEPRSPGPGASLAQGTRRTVRWYSPGCVYNDISLDAVTTLATSVPNTGYAIVTIPAGATVGSHFIYVSCKDSAGNIKDAATTLNFNVTASSLQILAPGRDDIFDAGASITVAWKKTSAITSVFVDLSVDGGVSFTSTFGPFTTTSTRITLPGPAAVATAVMRVRSTSPVASDFTDGYFAIRGTGQAFINMTSRKLVSGGTERLEWSSPAGSRLVDITATSASVTKTVAPNLPDRGNFDWVLPDMPPGAITFAATFKNSAGTTVGTATNAAATVGYATTISYGSLPSTLGIGNGAGVTTTTNSGLPATLTSLTTSVCTVSGSTVTGVAAGTCIIAANQAGNASYAAALQVTARFTVGTVSNPPRLGNISTRMQVLTGNDVMIGGFVIGGSANKTVAIVATGPSLAAFGIVNPLADPTLTLVRSSDQQVIATNDNWQTAGNAAQLQAAGFAPSNTLESAILINLAPGAYTAIVSGVGGGTGVGIVAVYEVDRLDVPLVNISTRGRVLTGNDVMIGGFIINGSGAQTVAIVATGPSLAAFGIANPLANPTLTLVRSSDQAVIATNDDWQSAPNAAQIQAAGFAPSNQLESAIMMSLPPGAYTAIVSGVSGGTGVGIVAVYTVP